MPGDWVSLAFVVSASEQPIQDELALFELPLGWSMVVPPRPVSLAKGQSQTLTLAVAVPSHAPAGPHEVVMTLRHQSVSAHVDVEASVSLEWLADDAATEPQRWWVHRPWVGRASLLLRGNQSLEVGFSGRAPAGVTLDLSSTEHRLMPDAPVEVMIKVSLDSESLRPLPKQLPIAVDVVDAKQSSVLLSRRWVLLPMTMGEGQLPHRPWRLRGFVDWRSSLREKSVGMTQSSAWGIEGSGDWDRSGDQAVSFAWHRDARWGRYVGFDGQHLSWRVGHQVFMGERLDGLSRLGRGLRATWQRDTAPNAWRVGWIQFEGQGGQGLGEDEVKQDALSPWWSWRGWRVAYIDVTAGQAGSSTRQQAWSLSYQQPRDFLRQPKTTDHWGLHVTGNRNNIAGRFEYRRRLPDQTRWDIMAESIPKDHISNWPAGTRVRVRSHHRLSHQAFIQTSFLASHESNNAQILHRRDQWMAHYWRPIHGLAGLTLDDFQLGLGVTHRRDRTWTQQPSSAGRIVKQSAHRSEWSVRLRGRVGTWHLSGRLDTEGRFGLASHWLQLGLGQWRLSLQNTLKEISLESVQSEPWRWSVALARQQPQISSNQVAAMRFAGLKEVNTGNTKLQIGLSRGMQSGQEWSLALSTSLVDQRDVMLWLRHRWQANVSSPMPTIQRLVGSQPGHVISGCARQITPAGAQPIVGVMVFLNEQSMLTDREGCYRFVGLDSGHHRLSIDPTLALADPNESMATHQNLNRRDWLLTTSDHVDLWLGSAGDSSLSMAPLSRSDQTHQELTHDWAWVQPGRVVVSMDWPQSSPVDAPSRDAVLNALRLVGTCPSCPAAHQKRTAKRNGAGQWVVERLMPGDWHWRWAGGLLPDEHEWVETHRSLSVAVGQTRALVWAMRYQPGIIDWQRTEVVEIAP